MSFYYDISICYAMCFIWFIMIYRVFQVLSGKESTFIAGDAEDKGSIPGSWRSSGQGKDKPFQFSCLENPMHSGAWWATVHGLQSWTGLSDRADIMIYGGFPTSSVDKKSAWDAGDTGYLDLIPGSGRSPVEGNDIHS